MKHGVYGVEGFPGVDFASLNFFFFIARRYSERFRLTSWSQVVGRPQVREWQWGDIHLISPRGWDNTGEWGLGTGDWGVGTGDWGLGTGDWGLGTGDWGWGLGIHRARWMRHWQFGIAEVVAQFPGKKFRATPFSDAGNWACQNSASSW